MISAEKWWQIIERYNTQIYPLQIIFWIIAVLLVVWLFIKPGRLQNILIKVYLSITFAWIGIMFFLILAGDITGDNYGNYLFGSMFIVVSILFAIDIFRNKMHFSLPEARWRKYSTLFLMLLVFCYPFFGIAFGHNFGSLIAPGTLPCPTTALALILLATALPRVNKIVYILLLLWAVPTPPFIQIPKYGVFEDSIMLACGVYSLVLLVMYWKDRKSSFHSAGKVRS
jgi:hypothetical protein